MLCLSQAHEQKLRFSGNVIIYSVLSSQHYLSHVLHLYLEASSTPIDVSRKLANRVVQVPYVDMS